MKLSTPVPIRHNRLRLAQGNMFWHEAGQGQAVVFLHGTWHDSSQWLPLVQALAPQYHCIAPDLLGFGESLATCSPHSIALEVEGLQALLTTLRVQKVSLVGHSIGAWVALALAQRDPDRVQNIIVVEPEGFMPKPLRRRWLVDRWLIAPWSPLAWGLSGLTHIMQRLGFQGLSRWRQRRQRLQSAPAACQLLFRRRWSEILAEQVTAQPYTPSKAITVLEPDETLPTTHYLTEACLKYFPWANHHILPAAHTPLGVKQAAIEDVLRKQLGAEPQAVSPASAAMGAPH